MQFSHNYLPLKKDLIMIVNIQPKPVHSTEASVWCKVSARQFISHIGKLLLKVILGFCNVFIMCLFHIFVVSILLNTFMGIVI